MESSEFKIWLLSQIVEPFIFEIYETSYTKKNLSRGNVLLVTKDDDCLCHLLWRRMGIVCNPYPEYDGSERRRMNLVGTTVQTMLGNKVTLIHYLNNNHFKIE
jgi:hypothetical protein